MFCPKCGVQLPDDARFCGACGSQMPAAAQAPQAEAPAGAGPRTQAAPAGARRRRPVAIAVAAVVAVVAVGVGVAAFLTHGFGLLPGRYEAYVLQDRTYTYTYESRSSNPSTFVRRELDEHGNCTRLVSGGDAEEKICSYAYDEDGFLVSMDLSGEGAVSFANEFDSRGRLTRSTMTYGDLSLAAEYSYYGDSDNVSRIDYSPSSATSVEGAAIILGSLAATQFAGIDSVNIFLTGGEDSYVCFAEDGALDSYGLSGERFPAWASGMPTREELAGQALDPDSSGPVRIATYDDRGYLARQVVDGTSLGASWDELVIEYTRVRVEDASRAAATFSRLSY